MPSVTWDVNTYNNSFQVKDEWGGFQTPVIDQSNAHKSYAQLADMMCIGPAAMEMPEKSLEVYRFLHNDDILLQIQESGVEFIGLESIQTQVTSPPLNTPIIVGVKLMAEIPMAFRADEGCLTDRRCCT